MYGFSLFLQVPPCFSGESRKWYESIDMFVAIQLSSAHAIVQFNHSIWVRANLAILCRFSAFQGHRILYELQLRLVEHVSQPRLVKFATNPFTPIGYNADLKMCMKKEDCKVLLLNSFWKPRKEPCIAG